MPTQDGLYQDVVRRIQAASRSSGLRKTAVARMALLVTGMMAAQSCVIARMAAALDVAGVTRATDPASIERRLRRALDDERLADWGSYATAVRDVVDWFTLLGGEHCLVVIVDESSQAEHVHLLRLSLAYWGSSLPLAWELWPPNVCQAPGAYWRAMERVLDRVASLLPRGLEVVVVADRAYDIPPFVDRISARGWHWVVRCKAAGTLRVRDRPGHDQALRDVLARTLDRPGRRWKARALVFKDAGWRDASIVAVWAPDHDEPLVTLADLPCRWDLHAYFDQRFWTEPGFRNDKAAGWDWEHSQVRDRAHQAVLVGAMAWASLVTLCLGRAVAEEHLAQQESRAQRRHARGRAPAHPQHARASLFRLGLHRAHCWLVGRIVPPIRWVLDAVTSISWNQRWIQAQIHLVLLYQTVRP
jgi:DDE family transposase